VKCTFERKYINERSLSISENYQRSYENEENVLILFNEEERKLLSMTWRREEAYQRGGLLSAYHAAQTCSTLRGREGEKLLMTFPACRRASPQWTWPLEEAVCFLLWLKKPVCWCWRRLTMCRRLKTDREMRLKRKLMTLLWEAREERLRREVTAGLCIVYDYYLFSESREIERREDQCGRNLYSVICLLLEKRISLWRETVFKLWEKSMKFI